MSELTYKVIVLEGKTDESFILEYINQTYEISYSYWTYGKPEYSKLINVKDINKFILTYIAESKDNLVSVATSLIRDSMSGMLPKISDLLIIRDFDKLSKDQIFDSITTAFITK